VKVKIGHPIYICTYMMAKNRII